MSYRAKPMPMPMLALAFMSISLMGVSAMAQTLNFDDAPAGTSPEGWILAMTGRGEAKWTVEPDSTAPSKPNVLKQSGRATYPVALKQDTDVRDGFVEAKFKAVTGSEDRAAGVIWRAKNADNYYVVRANALEDNVVLYKDDQGSSNVTGHRWSQGRIWRQCARGVQPVALAALRLRRNAVHGDVRRTAVVRSGGRHDYPIRHDRPVDQGR
ncbi:hypothetical protein ACVWW2_007341 [Bradyrhizobium sp. LM4.3]